MSDRDILKGAERQHPAIPELAEQLRDGKIGRRDFLRTASLLGLTAAASYAVAGKMTGTGMIAPAAAAHHEGKKGGNLRVSMNIKEISDPAVFDWSEKGNVARQFIEQLVRINQDNIAEPYLAESWQPSDDLKTWTFNLRQGVKWSNGDDFGADDVIANFARWIDPEVGSSNQGRFAAVQEVPEKIDDHTLRFNLATADLSLPQSMGDYPALIAHRRFMDEGGDLAKNPVGTGPFELKEFEVGGRAVLTRRLDEHFTGPVYLDQITYIDNGADPSAELAAFASGQIDLNYQSTVEQTQAIAAIPTLDLLTAATAQTGVVRFRVSEKPFDDPRVRQAIAAATDNARLLELVYQNLGELGQNYHVAPIHPDHAPLPLIKPDIERAKALLAEAGYADGLEVDMQAVDNPKWESSICVAMAEMVRPAGIKINVNILPGGTYWDRWDKWPFSLTAWTHRPLGTQVLNLAYRSGVAWNECAYNNPEFDRLLDQAGGIFDVEARHAVMAKLEKILQDDGITVIPFFRSVFVTKSKKVKNFNAQVALEHHLNQVWLDA